MATESSLQQLNRVVFGAGLALAGAAAVELLIAGGLKPLSPLGLPAMASVIASVLFGLHGFFGATIVCVGYYLFNAAQAARFPEFFAGAGPSIAWLGGIGILCGVVLFLRSRLAEAQAAAQLAHALRESEERMRLIAENVPALIGYVDREQRFLMANRAYEEWFGLRSDRLIGRTVLEAWGDERYRVIEPNMIRALAGERVIFEYNFLDRGGRERQVLAQYVPDLDEAGKARGFFVLGTDITALAQTRRDLRLANERLEHALEGSSAAMWDSDLRTGRVYLSEPWAQMLGSAPGETITTFEELFALTHPEDLAAIKKAAVDLVTGANPLYAVEHRVRSGRGEWRWILSRGRVTARDPDTGRALRAIGTNLDITDRKRVEEKLQSEAQTDLLTGLANRVLLGDRMRLAMARSIRSGARCALLYLDLDRFKEVNDRFGHAAGDLVLKDFAARLRACVRQTDTVARVGGDEFVILLEDLKDEADARRIADKVLEQTQAATRFNGAEIGVTTSIGLAPHGGDADEMAWLARADAALYKAKDAGRNSIAIAA